MTDEEYIYLWTQFTEPDKKLPNVIYQKLITGEELTKKEETIVSKIIRKDMKREKS